MFFAQLAIDFIMCIPLLAASCVVVMAIRAVVKGQVIVSSKLFPRRKITRSANPIQFWVEIGLYFIAAVFLCLLGLLFFDVAPNWFYELMLHKSRHA
jgi:hypothetical protein